MTFENLNYLVENRIFPLELRVNLLQALSDNLVFILKIIL
jgi:hypothetical protein